MGRVKSLKVKKLGGHVLGAGIKRMVESGLSQPSFPLTYTSYTCSYVFTFLLVNYTYFSVKFSLRVAAYLR